MSIPVSIVLFAIVAQAVAILIMIHSIGRDG